MALAVDTDRRLLRGRILSFRDEPQGPDDHASYRYVDDGAVLIDGSRIVAVGDFAEIATAEKATTPVVDHRPHLLLAGFIDTHLHFPQTQAIASWGSQLMDWLHSYTFPAEARFADPEHCKAMAATFLDLLTVHGTTTAAVYGSVHHGAADALLEEAAQRNYSLIAGKTMMDRNAPESVLDTPQTAYDDSKALIERWHGHKRLRYAITPRFAITSSHGQLAAAAALKAEHPDCHLQTHLSENAAEIALTAELHPEARDYLDVYERHDLLGPKSLFGHCIHLSDRERAAMAETGSVAVFCPTSNLFLGSGLFDEAALRAAGVRTAIATDIGGGTSYSMLKTLDEGYKVLQLRRQQLAPLRALYWVTLGNARALSLEDRIGRLEPGFDADIVVLDSRATKAMAVRMETVETLSEELFVLQTLGDDRAVAAVYVAGATVNASGD